DGASTDGSLALIHKYEPHISRWISEPDKGLYDAMNKGIDLATGDFIWFINAGDTLRKEHTVSKMIAQIDKDTDIIYGEVMLINERGKELGTRSQCTTQRLPDNLSWQSLRYGMVVCHQGFLPCRSIVPHYIQGNLSADIHWVIECLKKSKRNTKVKGILANYLVGGLSKSRHHQSLKDRYHILKKHFGFIPNLWAHAWILLRAFWAKYVLRKPYV
ncbi:MAG TPA: glycosyltransferase, partial [Phaeodactylibacter sp.]|nr:glycosyltransferase [Phaeodactylibacter sp.]